MELWCYSGTIPEATMAKSQAKVLSLELPIHEPVETIHCLSGAAAGSILFKLLNVK